MTNRISILLLTAVLGFTLKGCNEVDVFTQTGEWISTDNVIYFKNTGTEEKTSSPTGWININDTKYDYITSKQHVWDLSFYYYDEANKVKGDEILGANVKLTKSGNFTLTIVFDNTNTFTKQTKFTLTKLSD